MLSEKIVAEWGQFVVKIVKCKLYQDVFLDGLPQLLFLWSWCRICQVKGVFYLTRKKSEFQ
jgi:hypothetical protein